MTGVLTLVVFTLAMAGMMLVKLFGAVRAFEFMAFAGNAGQRDSHDKQGEKFHRGAS